MRIALDVDGVLLDFEGSWRAVAERVLGQPLVQVAPDYQLMPRYGLSRSQCARVWHAFVTQKTWERLTPLKDHIAVAQRLSQQHELHLVTAIPATLALARRRNLLDLGLRDFTLHCVGLKGHKAATLSAIAPDLYVDDRLRHLAEGRTAGVPRLGWLDHGDTQDLAPWRDLVRGNDLHDLCQTLLRPTLGLRAG